MVRSGVALLTLGLLAGIASADEPTDKQKQADKLFGEGRDFLQKKMPKEACEKFEQANQLDPLAAGTKLNLGLCYEELGKFHTALKWFREAQARASESNLPDHEAAAKEHTASLAMKVPSITVEFEAPIPSDPAVTIDGEAIKASDFGHVEVDPGHHVLIVKATGKRIARQEFDILEKSQKAIKIAMVDGDSTVILDPGKPRRYAAYGLVVAGVGLWVYTLYYGLDKKDTYDQAIKDDDRAKANEQVKDLKIWGTTMFCLGAAAVGGAAVLYFTAPERRSVEATAFAPIVTNDTVGFAFGGRF